MILYIVETFLSYVHILMWEEYMHTLLTKREKEIFTLLIDNYSTFEISETLNISEKTVRNHISNVIQKLGVSSRIQAVLELLRMKEIEL